MTDPPITLSEQRLAEILDLRFAQFEKAISAHFVSETRAREIVRDEFGIASRGQWEVRSKIAAVGVFLLSISTFVFTMFQNWHGGGAAPPP